MFAERKERKLLFYFPGKSEGQPFKADKFKQCYHFVKQVVPDDQVDKFGKFLEQADQKINYWQSPIGRKNPYNQFNMSTEFTVNEVSDVEFIKVKDRMKAAYGMTLNDNMMVMEGCVNDDKIILGGKNEFMSHFCTFFNFSACLSGVEGKALKNTRNMFADHEQLDKKLEDFVNSFDKKD